MRDTTNLRLTFCLAMLLIPFACTDNGGNAGDAGSEGEGECVAGQSVACMCDDDSNGAQTCEPDGSGFGECTCTGGDGDGDATGDGDGDSTGDGDPTTGDGDGDGDEWDGVSLPSWSNHIVPFFYDSCGAGTDGCHSRTAFHAEISADCRGWLSLEDMPLGSVDYAGPNVGLPTGCPDMGLADRLSTLAPWQCAADSAYVAPGDLDNSYVWQKIQGTNLCEVAPGQPSSPMPPATSMIVLTDMQKAMIEAWILGGAPYDN